MKKYLLLLIFLSSNFLLYAQEDTISLKTYYPSPCGIYHDLTITNSLSIGDTPAVPLEKGQIYAGQSMVLKSLSSDPAVSDSVEGQVIYNSTDKSLKFFNGSEWKGIIQGNEDIIVLPGETTCPAGTSIVVKHWLPRHCSGLYGTKCYSWQCSCLSINTYNTPGLGPTCCECTTEETWSMAPPTCRYTTADPDCGACKCAHWSLCSANTFDGVICEKDE